jgi:hypothetical protein
MARPVTFSEDGARRVIAATKAYEGGNRSTSPIKFRDPGGDDSDPVRLGKTTSAWNKGTLQTINVWESGTPPNETQSTGVVLVNCVNKFANVPSGKWVMMARGGTGYWYLIAAECG